MLMKGRFSYVLKLMFECGGLYLLFFRCCRFIPPEIH
uniref:Uncharacterized protein n=1 Tax=Rhizophora mucronata TaxID=61149 RepID=A0A2P2MEJ3_RHIMU